MDPSLRDLARSVYKKIIPQNEAGLERLMFLHLPKCGGTSLHAALNGVYVHRNHHVTHLDPHASKKAAKILGDSIQDFRIRLLLYHMAHEKSRYISGHYAFSERAWNEFGNKWKFMTVLREPVARWYSTYFYNKYKTNSDHFRIHEPLDVFVESETARGEGNMYVQLLTEDRDAEDAVKRVIGNLQRFHLVGVLEEMDTLVRDCERVLGVSLKVGQKNTSPRTEQEDEITPEIDKRVRLLCEPNLRVYEAVRERIIQQGSWLNG